MKEEKYYNDMSLKKRLSFRIIKFQMEVCMFFRAYNTFDELLFKMLKILDNK